MQVKAKARNLSIGPRKIRLVANAIVGLPVQQSVDALSFMNKKGARLLKDIVLSAIANAQHNHRLDARNLMVKEIIVNEGQKIFRYMPKAFGRATKIRKRLSHVEVTLDEMVPSATPETPQKKGEAKEMTSTDVLPDVKNIAVKKGKSTKKGEEQEAHAPEIFDVRGKGKHRHMQHQDKKTMKKAKKK